LGRREKPDGNGPKARGRKTTRRIVKPSSITTLKKQLDDALEQQVATAELLDVISRSVFDLQPVLDGIVSTASRLCDAEFAIIFKLDKGKYHVAASNNADEVFVKYASEHPIAPGRGSLIGRTALEGKTVHLPDCLADPEYTFVEYQQAGRYRSDLGVPLLRDGVPIGVIALMRTTVKPFTDKEIALVETFASQAVIAIENARLLGELRESLQQQTTTSEILEVISNSPTDTQPAFDAIVRSGLKLFPDAVVVISLPDGDSVKLAAIDGADQHDREALRARYPLPLSREYITSTAILDRREMDFADARETPEHLIPGGRNFLASGYRAIAAVPMIRGESSIGAISVLRRQPGALSDKQRELLRTFANQAVIAIENTRLFKELRQRTDDLSESLEQQTATSEVLKVISNSQGQVEPVFNAMLENATRMCEAKFGTLYLCHGDALYAAAFHNAPLEFIEARKNRPLHPPPDSTLGRAARTKRAAQILDSMEREAYRRRDPFVVAGTDLGGYRTIVSVPMLKDDELIGAISIYRQEVAAFTEKQIELVKDFAAQAVIAIENARLLTELRESLEQQTATSEVLRIISSSAGELEPAFQTMLANATKICEAAFGSMLLLEGDEFRRVAVHNAPPQFAEFHRQTPVVNPQQIHDLRRLVETRRPVHIVDAAAVSTDSPIVKYAGARTLLIVPLLKDDALIGAIGIYRQEVRPFTDKQIELVKNFASQAVIAIENARLLNELRESLQQQTATADVLKVISRSAFDLHTVLYTLIEAAVRLCNADHGNIAREQDGVYQRVATYGYSDAFTKHLMNLPVTPDRGTATGRSLLEGKVVHIHDVRADPEYTFVAGQKLGDYRTALSVPMLREGTPIGILALTRREVRPFTDKQIELVTTFADQAAIAIENVRLFESVQKRTHELATSLENLRTTQDRLVQTQKLASLGQLTAGIAHEMKNPLNFVNNFSGLSAELIDELQETLKGLPFTDKARGQLNELTGTLRDNLEKIVHHGMRADAIVKNMLLHSREASGEHRRVDINAIVDESLNMAWHGARAEKQGFSIVIERSFDPAAGEADVFPQEITRALLNLISNAFYAARKWKGQAGDDRYEPTLVASTRSLGDRVQIGIRDNGTGIPPDVKEKMFDPFFTTKPAGEGTGLGLSISHDIIVKQHAGSIEVDTQPGEFTEFRIVLPRTAASL
jgi:two-component system, NtrC family, sensor kinase